MQEAAADVLTQEELTAQVVRAAEVQEDMELLASQEQLTLAAAEEADLIQLLDMMVVQV